MDASERRRWTLLLLTLATVVATSRGQPRCETLEVEICKPLGYNLTYLPSWSGYETQREAQEELSSYKQLVETGCSTQTRLFLCSVFAPVCAPGVGGGGGDNNDQQHRLIPPCRSLCVHVREGCRKILSSFSIAWPQALDCGRFPVDDNMCVPVKEDDRSLARGAAPPLSTSRKTYQSHSSDLHHRQGGSSSFVLESTRWNGYPSLMSECPRMMHSKSFPNYRLDLHNNITLHQCSLPCAADDRVTVFLSSTSRAFVRHVLFWLAVLALLCCLFALATFLADITRFHYPTRPIVYLTACQTLLALVYVTSLFSGSTPPACVLGSTATANDPPHYIVQQAATGDWCGILGIAHEIALIGSCCWWVMMCACYFLSACRQWSDEAIERYASLFHIVSWGVPFVLATLLIVVGGVDGDVWSGACSAGNLRPSNLIYFRILPTIACLVLGGLFLVRGAISMLDMHHYFKMHQAMPVAAHDRSRFCWLMVRVIFFAALCSLAFIVQLMSIVLQAWDTELWLTVYYFIRCRMADRSTFGFITAHCPDPPFTEAIVGRDLQNSDVPLPSEFWLIARYAGELAPALLCALWVTSAKTMRQLAVCCRCAVERNDDTQRDPALGHPLRLIS